jgi:iron complex transport system substrate-binding protein
MLASATEIVAALGLEDRLVAISHECDFPPGVLDRPRVSRPRFDPTGMDSGAIDQAVRQAMLEHGSVYEIDGETLARLDPSLIITQAVCEVCAVPTPGVREVARKQRLHAQILSLDAHRLEDVLDSVLAVGAAAGVAGRAAGTVAAYRARIDRVRSAVANEARPRVLGIEWLDPPFVPGHWVPEMIEIAGGICLAGVAGRRSTETDWDRLAALDPDVLLIFPCGFGLDAAQADADRHSAQLLRVGARAVAAGRAWVADGSAYFNRSGPRTVDGIEILASLLHPAVLGQPPADTARVWNG